MRCQPSETLKQLPITLFCEWWVYLIVSLVVLAVITGVLIVCCVPSIKRRVFPYRHRVAHRMTTFNPEKTRVLSPRGRDGGGITRL